MFKKPLADYKTIAPLRTSDRRKLKERVLDTFKVLQPEEGDLLVPEGLHWQKITTYSDEPGVVYFSLEGDPLWFTVGKDSDDLIPTVYTLWKRPDLLPYITTPSAVIPKLINGADLMIPGVVQHSDSLVAEQLVAIEQYHDGGKIGYPVSVGRMAVSGETLQEAEDHDVKGKAVHVLHTWKDALWDMGITKASDVPEPRSVRESTGTVENGDLGGEPNASAQDGTTATTNGGTGQTESAENSVPALTADDISHGLRSALLQALSTTLASVPPSTFPMSASTFWSSYVLPARPAEIVGSNGLADASALDVKHSTYKSVKAFLKACAKEGLIKLKDAKGGDVVVAAVFPKHQAVVDHRPVRTVQEIEARQQKAEDRERREREAEEKRKGELQVTELWKPFGSTLGWFVAADKETGSMYTLPEIKTILNSYIASKNLINAQEQQYVNIRDDPALLSAVTNKNEIGVEFLKREEVLSRLKERMQSWYEIRVEGKDVVKKKGPLKPVQVLIKIRQGRKACTLVSGFEPYYINAEDLAEELRKICASSTSISPVQGKASDMEVMVQGKQIKAVTDLLIAKGVPKAWIESADMTAGKKKK